MTIIKKVQQVIVNAISYLKCPYGNECMTMIYRNVWLFQFRAAWSPTCRGCGGRWRRCSPSPAPSPAASPAAESTRSRLRAGVSENREKIWAFHKKKEKEKPFNSLQFTVIFFISHFCVLCFPCMYVSVFSFCVWKPRGSSKLCHACVTTIKDLKCWISLQRRFMEIDTVERDVNLFFIMVMHLEHSRRGWRHLGVTL